LRRSLRGTALEGNVPPADGRAAPASAADVPPTQGRPVRLVLLLLAAFVAAVACARMLLAGGAGWVAFALLLPVLLLVLGRWLGVARAFVLVAFFAAATLGLRAVLSTPRIGWSLLLLVPVLGFSTLVATRVVLMLRAGRHA
jgi:hypothetical protein